MDVRTLIAPVRDSYVRAFERTVREFKQDRNRHCMLEYSLGQSQAAEHGVFALPVRHDLLPLVDGRPESITTIREDEPVQVNTAVVEVSNVPVTIRQFTWDHFELRAAGVKQSANLTSVLAWFDRWFDRIGRRPEMAGGVRGVVHSLSGPFWTENGMTIEVDLGTATCDALLDLLYAVTLLAPTAMEIISPSLEPEKRSGWDIAVPDGWEPAEEIPDQPATYTREQSVLRVSIEEGAALNRDVTEAVLADDVRQLAMRSGARKTAHVSSGTCPLGLYAAIEWRTLEHGTIRLWMLSNRRDMVSASLIGDDLSEREIREVTDSVMAIAPKV